jgi:hypothetical protein
VATALPCGKAAMRVNLMDFMEHLLAIHLKKNAAGEIVYRPYGIYGRGFIATENKNIRIFLTRFYVSASFIFFSAYIFLNFLERIMLGAGLFLVFYFYNLFIVKGLKLIE